MLTHTRQPVTMVLRQIEANRYLLRRTVMLSARNQLPATIKSVKLGNVMAEVVMTVGNVELVAPSPEARPRRSA